MALRHRTLDEGVAVVLLDAVANGEERGLRAMLGQHVEHLAGLVAPRAVVERERDHLVVAHVGRYVASHDVAGLLYDPLGRDAGHFAGLRGLNAVLALALYQVYGAVALLRNRPGNGRFHGVGRFLDRAAVAYLHDVSGGQLGVKLGDLLAVHRGVERLPLACLQHAAVHGQQVARLGLDAAGGQGVAERLVAVHFDARSVQRDVGGQALHEQHHADDDNGHQAHAGEQTRKPPAGAFGFLRDAHIAVVILVGGRGGVDLRSAPIAAGGAACPARPRPCACRRAVALAVAALLGNASRVGGAPSRTRRGAGDGASCSALAWRGIVVPRGNMRACNAGARLTRWGVFGDAAVRCIRVLAALRSWHAPAVRVVRGVFSEFVVHLCPHGDRTPCFVVVVVRFILPETRARRARKERLAAGEPLI